MEALPKAPAKEPGLKVVVKTRYKKQRS